MKRFALDTTRASLIIFAVVVAAAAQCCIPFKFNKEGEGKKTLKSFNPEIFFPAARLPELIRIPHKTKPPPTQQNETSKQASKQCAQKGFQIVTATLPAGDTPVHHPTNPREISLKCHIHFSIFGYHKRTRHPKYPSLSLCALALNRNPKSSYSRYVEIHLMGIRILAGRRRKAAETKAIRQELPHPDRKKERNPEP
jgi:hypothetical protein